MESNIATSYFYHLQMKFFYHLQMKFVKVMFSQVCLSTRVRGSMSSGVSVRGSLSMGVSLRGCLCLGVSVRGGGFCPGGMSLSRGSLPRGVFVQRVSVQVVSLSRQVSVQGSLSRGDPPVS